jgi:thioredoxin 1
LTLWQRIHSFGPLSGSRRRRRIEARERSSLASIQHSEEIPMAVGKVSDADFDSEVLKATGAVVVDFWAEWCGPCRQIAPALEEIAGSLNGKVKIVKLNVDENPQTASKYGVMSIPTLMLFKNGEMASRQVGAAPKQKLEQWITGAM